MTMKRIFIIVFLLFAFSARTCDGLCLHYDCWSWSDKPAHEDVAPAPEPESWSFRIITNIFMWFTIAVTSVQWLIEAFKVHIELGVFLIIFWLALKLLTMLRQGRPTNNDRLSSDKKGEKAKATANTPVNATTNIHICNRARTNLQEESSEENMQSLIINLRNKPDKFAEGMDVETWIKQLEVFLQPIDKQSWLPIASTYISDRAFKRVNCERITEFEQFKERLVDAYAQPKDPIEQVKKVNIYNLKQGANETVGEFGRSLISIAQETFPKIALDSLDEVLKENFIKGILDPRLRQKLEWKRRKMRELKNKEFTIHELIKHAKVAQQAYDSESGSYTEDDRALQICATQVTPNESKTSVSIDATQQETLRLQGMIAELLSQNEEAKREREERRAFFESKKRSRDRSANGYRQQQPTYPRNFQGSQWTPHEGSQRWPYAAQEYPNNQMEQQPVLNQAQNHMQQPAMQTMQGRHSTPPMAAARQ